MRRVIKWEWWEHPLGGGTEYTDEAAKAKPEDDWQAYEEEKYGGGDDPHIVLVRPVIPTPAGIVPVHVYGSISRAFNFWIGHTNFDLTPDVRDLIKNVPGVETLDIFTRYRMRVGFGKVFDAVQVKHDIQEVCDAQPPKRNEENPEQIKLDSNTRQRVDLLKRQANDRHKFWLVYVLPNGEIVFAHAEEENAYKDRLELCREAQELAGGIIFTCEDQ